MPDWSSIAQHLDEAGVRISQKQRPKPIGGGDISAAWRVSGDNGDVFLKTGQIASLDMFTAEAEGLAELAKPKALRVPEVLAVGRDDDTAFLALEWLAFERAGTDVERRLGERLAMLHRTTASQFGWHRDNTIGLTPQHNA